MKWTSKLLVASMMVLAGGLTQAKAQYPVPIITYPQYPVIVTPNQFIGVLPGTGQLVTSNIQVDSTYFAPGRSESMFNNTMREVNRPIYDQYGNVVGTQSGVEWYNPQAGVWNGRVNNTTVTPDGNINIQKQFYMPAPKPLSGPSVRPVFPGPRR